jgi:excisionase family DNA binding protein
MDRFPVRGVLHDPAMTQKQTPPVEAALPDRLLNVQQLADLLGVNVRHIRRLVPERRVPFIKWGHLVRFDPHEIERWLHVNTEPVQAS